MLADTLLIQFYVYRVLKLPFAAQLIHIHSKFQRLIHSELPIPYSQSAELIWLTVEYSNIILAAAASVGSHLCFIYNDCVPLSSVELS